MNAVLTSPDIAFDPTTAPAVERAEAVANDALASAVDATIEPRSFGGAVLRFLPASAIAVFVLATFGLSFVTTIGAAAGLALFLAFWLGAGFGTVAAGVYWALDQNPH
ncbi:MAG: hypothetical protein AAF467_01485 [Actinomycetota bacterium]